MKKETLSELSKVSCLFLFPLFIMGQEAKASILPAYRWQVPVTQQSVTGSIVDETGQPIIGATISVKNSSNAVSTDVDGKFAILAQPGDVLVIKYMGYIAQELTLANQSNLAITLQPDQSSLEEVVVVGYGTQRKANITGAISNIKADDLVRVSPSNLSNTLAGRAPGVNVTNTSGMAGASSRLRIRGSFAEPLYVIDGIVRDKAAFDVLEANEVDQMSFLKDAATAAVYGTRAGNGVVVVTTKKGVSQAPVFNVQSNYTFNSPTQTLLADLTTATDELIYQNRVAEFQGLPIPNGEDEFAYFANRSYNANDWIWRNPFSHRQSVSVNGGGDRITYFALVNYRGENGSYQSLDHEKFNIRSNVSAKISDAFSIDLNIAANQTNSNRFFWPFSTSSNDDDFDVSDFYRVTFNWPKMYPFYLNEDGSPSSSKTPFPVQTPMGSWQAWNVIDQVLGDRYIDRKVRQVNPILSLNLKLDKLVPGLSTRVVGSYLAEDYLRKRYMSFQKNYTFQSLDPSGNRFIPAPPDENRINIFTFSQPQPFVDYVSQRKWEYQLNWFLNYARAFGRHNIDAMLSLEQWEFGLTNINSLAENPITALDQMFVYPTDRTFRYTNAFENINARQAAIGRVNYNFADRYIAEFSFRYDGAVLFPEEKRWGFFPSMSAAWRLSEEGFFSGIKKTVNDLKIRASYGTTGNYLDENADPISQFTYAEKYNTTTGSIFGDRYYNGLAYGNTPNPLVTWTRSQSYNGGIDFAFLQHKLSGSVDAFLRQETDILASRTIRLPDTYGRTLAKENYAARSYRGGEITLNWNDNLGQVAYGVSANIGYAIDRWDIYDEEPAYGPNGNMHFRSRIGRPHNRLTGLRAVDLVRTQAQLDELLAAGFTTYGRAPYLGMILFDDIRGANFSDGGDGKIDENDEDLLSTNNSPRYNYGFALNAAWKNFSISALFQGVLKYDRMISNQEGGGVRQHGGTFRPYYPLWTDDVWTTDNTDAKYPRPVGSNWAESGSMPSTFWIRNGAYMRLRDLNITYSLPTDWVNTIKLKSVSLFFNGSNLFVLSPMTEFQDPEQLNYDSYPVMKTFTLGLDVKF
ncbi:SusC/RagA family TonB-linked outer membrane protein [Sphingobacterium paludis]|uniref:TonB-linked SusC/RagA family outer membrane protein n=1 Tax=Sphingobacterium paludis TaxID=1476465 RepID=A0A4R7CQS2_9SPHI|nr:SusC/RagA family TonB-linked outer membrane protein [Sphingobacterium paludis]TDS07528.1 TonB-linked SusC/RagA family outer membrane protein [Sphingobacterium paludis]